MDGSQPPYYPTSAGYGSPVLGLKRPANDDHYASAAGAASESNTPDFSDPYAYSHLPGGGDGAQHGAEQGVKDENGGGATEPKRSKVNTAPPLKRGTACTLCRKRKLRCDGVRPKCGTCLRLNHDCQYGDPTQERFQERQRELEDRIRSLEAELDVYRRSGPPGAAATNPSYPSIPVTPFSPSASVSASARPSPSRPGSAFPPLGPPSVGGVDYSPVAYGLGAYPPPGLPPHHLDGSPFPPPAQFPSAALPIEPPFLAHPNGAGAGYPPFPSLPPDTPLAPPPPQHPGLASARRDSEAFPLPPPAPAPGPSASFLSHAPIASASASASGSATTPSSGSVSAGGSAHPAPVPAASTSTGGVQSFPFPMSTTTPALSDLINPPSAISPPGQGHGFGGGGSSPAVAAYPHTHAQGILPPPPPGLQDGPQGQVAGLFGAELPELDIMLELADIYFSTLHSHLPFLHRRRFLYTLHHPASLASPPSLSLIFSVLALAAQYHDAPSIRASSAGWYAAAREKVEAAIAAGASIGGGAGGAGGRGGGGKATLTVEMVQALCLLALLEMGQSDHQRAFLSIGMAVRIAAMLGLNRMDEDRVAARTGEMLDKRLRPPALHQLPRDGVLLEECRRTMCTIFILDRFESATVGWPSAIAEGDIRVLLPCADTLFDAGTVDPDGNDNPLWWPADGGTSSERGWAGVKAEEDAEMEAGEGGAGGPGGGAEDAAAGLEGETAAAANGVGKTPAVGVFAWLCRVVWLGGRIQAETYRASGPPAGGPWNKHHATDPLASSTDILEMDRVLEYIRSKFTLKARDAAARGGGKGAVDGGVLMILLVVNCMLTNLLHLRAASGLSQLPWNPSAPIFIGSAEYAMQRCWEAIHSLHEIVSQLAVYENARTTLHRSRANTFTSFVPYALYALAFPAKWAIGDWSVLVASRDRTENVVAHVARDLPSGDDVFPPSYWDERLAFADVACEAMERIGVVWPIGKKFAAMVRGDRMRLAARNYERQHHQQQQHEQQQLNGHSHAHGQGHAHGLGQSMNGTGGVASSPTLTSPSGGVGY
ncbi:hypothetical protein JCM10207_002792 [Rhodosporidiobolus poonsookiae]